MSIIAGIDVGTETVEIVMLNDENGEYCREDIQPRSKRDRYFS